jgi:hypothetical protein
MNEISKLALSTLVECVWEGSDFFMILKYQLSGRRKTLSKTRCQLLLEFGLQIEPRFIANLGTILLMDEKDIIRDTMKSEVKENCIQVILLLSVCSSFILPR